jgi:tyrosinase
MLFVMILSVKKLIRNNRQPTGADGDPGNITTLNHVLNMYGNGPNRTIEEVMDIWNGVLCYEYVEPGY